MEQKQIKVFLLIMLFALAPQILLAQTRYLEPVFEEIEQTQGIPYGEAVEHDGDTVTLRFDLYEPVGDTKPRRPLIIWMHGGGFIFGTRQNGFNLYFADDFAKRGYTCASIDYRLGLQSGNQLQSYGSAIYRAVQDANAAIRFFHKHAGLYNIDTSFIVLAGSSAGSITAIHAAYWDQEEVPAFLDTTGLGTLEGNSGNPGYSTRFHTVVNCWGAISDTNYFDWDEQPIVSVHGTDDQTVPYESNGFMHGSAPIHRTAERLHLANDLLPFEGAGHLLIEDVGGIGNNWVESASFIADFLYDQLQLHLPSNVEEIKTSRWCYPTVTSGNIIIKKQTIEELRIYDLSGKLIDRMPLNSQIINLDHLPNGVYFLQGVGRGDTVVKRLVKK